MENGVTIKQEPNDDGYNDHNGIFVKNPQNSYSQESSFIINQRNCHNESVNDFDKNECSDKIVVTCEETGTVVLERVVNSDKTGANFADKTEDYKISGEDFIDSESDQTEPYSDEDPDEEEKLASVDIDCSNVTVKLERDSSPVDFDYSNVTIKSEYIKKEDDDESEFNDSLDFLTVTPISVSDPNSKTNEDDGSLKSIITKSKGEMQCLDCGKVFNKKYNLKRHISRSHKKLRPFQCEFCDKTFSMKYSLGEHKRIHSGVKPYSCEQCGKCFSAKSTYSRHLVTHTGVKPFQCQKCDKCFTQKTHLLAHMRAHFGIKLYDCSVCGKSFTEKRTLLNHSGGHAGLRPFPCPQCGKAFTHKSSMMRHKNAHCSALKSKQKLSSESPQTTEDVCSFNENIENDV